MGLVKPFKDIGKKCSDLLSKDFKVSENKVEVKTKTANGVAFTPVATKTDDKFAGSLAAKYGFPFATAEATLKTSGVVETSIESTKLAPGLTATLDVATPVPGKAGFLASGKATLDYKQELFSAKATYDWIKGDAACSLSTAAMGTTMGCDAAYSTSKSALTKYAVAAEYAQKDYTVAASLTEAVGKPNGSTYMGSYFHSVSSALQVGTEVKKAGDKDVALAFGCMYKLDKATTVKGKVDADGIISTSYKQVISPISTLTIAAQIDTVNLSQSSKHKMGFALNLTP